GAAADGGRRCRRSDWRAYWRRHKGRVLARHSGRVAGRGERQIPIRRRDPARGAICAQWRLAMKRLLVALAFVLLASAPATAQQQPGSDVADDLPAGVADENITVSSTYGGSYITVFGVNPDRRGRGDIVVVLRGPNEPATVLRKRRALGIGNAFGIWVNGDPVRFSEAP